LDLPNTNIVSAIEFNRFDELKLKRFDDEYPNGFVLFPNDPLYKKVRALYIYKWKQKIMKQLESDGFELDLE